MTSLKNITILIEVKRKENKMVGQLVNLAKEHWNLSTDNFNQWDTLGQDEKDELIEIEKKAYLNHIRETVKNKSLIVSHNHPMYLENLRTNNDSH